MNRKILLSISFLSFLILTFSGCEEAEEPVDIQALLANTVVNLQDDQNFTLFGNVASYSNGFGVGYDFPNNSTLPGCVESPSSYIQVDSLGPIWEDGFTVAGYVQFTEPRLFERIIDFGNGPGDLNGLNITFSRLGTTNHLALTSWINEDSLLNRTEGRVIAKDVIKEGEPMFVVGTISNSGRMVIYVDGVLVGYNNYGHPVLNVPRKLNYIGRSNWCGRDPDFKGKMDMLMVLNKSVSSNEVNALYDYLESSQ